MTRLQPILRLVLAFVSVSRVDRCVAVLAMATICLAAGEVSAGLANADAPPAVEPGLHQRLLNEAGVKNEDLQRADAVVEAYLKRRRELEEARRTLTGWQRGLDPDLHRAYAPELAANQKVRFSRWQFEYGQLVRRVDHAYFTDIRELAGADPGAVERIDRRRFVRWVCGGGSAIPWGTRHIVADLHARERARELDFPATAQARLAQAIEAHEAAVYSLAIELEARSSESSRDAGAIRARIQAAAAAGDDREVSAAVARYAELSAAAVKPAVAIRDQHLHLIRQAEELLDDDAFQVFERACMAAISAPFREYHALISRCDRAADAPEVTEAQAAAITRIAREVEDRWQRLQLRLARAEQVLVDVARWREAAIAQARNIGKSAVGEPPGPTEHPTKEYRELLTEFTAFIEKQGLELDRALQRSSERSE